MKPSFQKNISLRRKKSNELSIGEALQLFFEQTNLGETMAVNRVRMNWHEVLTPEIATRIDDSWRDRGIFYIKIPHAGWRHELSYGLDKIKDAINAYAQMEICKEVRLIG